MLQDLAMKRIVDCLDQISSVENLPSRLSIDLYNKIIDVKPWDLSLVRLLDSLHLTGDFINITPYFLSRPKALPFLLKYYSKHYKNSLATMTISNYDDLPNLKIPKFLHKFAKFQPKRIVFLYIDFEKINFIPFLQEFFGLALHFCFCNCINLDSLEQLEKDFENSYISLIDCSIEQMKPFRLASEINIEASSTITKLELPIDFKCKFLRLVNVDLSNFKANSSLQELHLQQCHGEIVTTNKSFKVVKS